MTNLRTDYQAFLEYKTFTEHPLFPLYQEYAKGLIESGFTEKGEQLLKIASEPITEDNMQIISSVLINIHGLAADDEDEDDDIFD